MKFVIPSLEIVANVRMVSRMLSVMNVSSPLYINGSLQFWSDIGLERKKIMDLHICERFKELYFLFLFV